MHFTCAFYTGYQNLPRSAHLQDKTHWAKFKTWYFIWTHRPHFFSVRIAQKDCGVCIYRNVQNRSGPDHWQPALGDLLIKGFDYMTSRSNFQPKLFGESMRFHLKPLQTCYNTPIYHHILSIPQQSTASRNICWWYIGKYVPVAFFLFVCLFLLNNEQWIAYFCINSIYCSTYPKTQYLFLYLMSITQVSQCGATWTPVCVAQTLQNCGFLKPG